MLTARVHLDDAETEFSHLKQQHGRSGQRAALLRRRWAVPVRRVTEYGNYIDIDVENVLNVAEIAVLMGTVLRVGERDFRLANIGGGKDYGLELRFVG